MTRDENGKIETAVDEAIDDTVRPELIGRLRAVMREAAEAWVTDNAGDEP